MKTFFKRATLIACVAGSLTGCAVYGPPPGAYYATQPTYGYAQPAAAYPGYYSAAPVYVEPPPVSFGLNFGYWGGGGWRHRR
ncbi:hypothetical protein E4K72_21310 [Oxalobacteraceae bacterium OM1]|nr:hypothetical protein E4K72_21310 [Oxalobacteraceae bacterium OM1]